MRRFYEEELVILNQELYQMGKLCEEILQAVTADLKGQQKELENIRSLEVRIDEKESVIEQKCMHLLLLQQPVAQDLRNVSAALKLISDLERIGDQALDIDELIPYVAKMDKSNLRIVIGMVEQCMKMLSESITSYIGRDIILAQKVIEEDTVVDELYVKQKEELIKLFEKAHPDAQAGLDILIIAKYLERIADHCTNVAEWTIFSVEGKRTL
ncbi:MAG: phosphate signaling complex protein PhoU [Lachnospiraceae bacterium]|nr:phosphate signaling complex protein PhoU [Lachnospiraceae bacterium]